MRLVHAVRAAPEAEIHMTLEEVGLVSYMLDLYAAGGTTGPHQRALIAEFDKLYQDLNSGGCVRCT